MKRGPTLDLPIAIIGGGLTGLSLLLGLLRRGLPHEVKLYESANCFEDTGDGVVLGPNALIALELIDPRLKNCF